VATRGHSSRWLPRAGFALGLAGAAGGLLAVRVPATPPGLGLDLTVVASAPKTLTLRPAQSTLLSAPGMRPGGRTASGSVTVLNPTARTQRVQVRVIPSSRGIDRALTVALSADGRRIYRGPLGRLRRPAAHPLVLQSGDGVELRLKAWLPRGATGWSGHIEDLNLAFDAVSATAR
jgi:hypothetical protein